MPSTRMFLLGLSALAASLPVAAQTPPAAPSLAAAPTVPAYRSAFEGYQPFAAGDVQDWRRSNDTARAIGGWRAYAREMQGGSQAPVEGATTPGAQQGGASDHRHEAAHPHAGHH